MYGGSETNRCCSFCAKSQKEVWRLIAGPRVYICNECIDESRSVLERQAREGPGVSSPSTDSPIPLHRGISGVAIAGILGSDEDSGLQTIRDWLDRLASDGIPHEFTVYRRDGSRALQVRRMGEGKDP